MPVALHDPMPSEDDYPEEGIAPKENDSYKENIENAVEACKVLQNKAGLDKYKSTIDFIESELHETLAYLNTQTCLIDDQSISITKFSKSVYEAKKMIVEQKIQLLKQLSALAVDQVKIKATDKDNIADITSLFSSK